MFKKFIILTCLFPLASEAAIDKLRVVWQENPESDAKVVWNQVSGDTSVLRYGKLDHGLDAQAYENSQVPQVSEVFKEMDTRFAKISGLDADTNYYFVIEDNEGVSQRYFFRTAADTQKPFQFIQGGDSRNNRDVRQDGNLLVSKIRPLFVSFGGDMTASNTVTQWQDWLDDWQLTVTADGRVFPIVPIRGNHEDASIIPGIFGVDNPDATYKISISDNLFVQYLLNSNIDTEAQKDWMAADLSETFESAVFLSASYHKPMRPHAANKSEGDAVYDSWAQLFYNYRFDLLCENDSHCVKRTVRVKPSSEAGSSEGFIAADDGYVLIGEGCWGAPLRSADDPKDWTLDSGAFNSFDIVNVHLDKVEVMTVDFAGAQSVGALTELDDTFALPSDLNIWQANGGAVQVIAKRERGGVIGDIATTVFNSSASWSYYDGIDAPDPLWMVSEFDASAWSVGDGELGYGDGDEATVLDYGGVSSNKTIAYYFRKQFSLSTVDDSSSLTLDLVFDDGAVIYVNGVELDRQNMAEGEVDHGTLALTTVNDKLQTILVPYTYLVAGENTVAIEVHQKSTTSSDVSFSADLVSNQNNVGDIATGVKQTVFEYFSEWAYYDLTAAPASDWNQLEFDGSAWANAASEFGYGDGDETTLLDDGGDPEMRTATYYFRKEFSLSAVDELSKLSLDLTFDDGAVVYCNGQEAGRVNIVSGPVAHTSYASVAVNNNATTTFDIPSSMLNVGNNVIAIELHNVNATSDDVSMNAQMFSNQENVGEAPVAEFAIFDFGGSWIYSDSVDAPAVGWQQTDFDDASWSYGVGEFGFGDGDESTLLDFGPDSNQKTCSYYFRKDIVLTAIDEESLLTLDLVYDDGMVIYMNGQEVERVRMADGVVTHTTFATSTVGNNAKISIIIPSSYLVVGRNSLAVEVHNRSGRSSDISFNAQLISNQENQGDLVDEIISYGDVWSYSDTIEAPATDWFGLSFDDGQWSVGESQFGFGDGDEATVLDFGPNSSDKTASYYFRHTVNLEHVMNVDAITMDLTYDDGAVIYVNGVEVNRLKMADGVVTHTTYASSRSENSKSSFTIPLSYFVEGENVIAIEIHNQNHRSSDVSMDAQLKVKRAQ